MMLPSKDSSQSSSHLVFECGSTLKRTDAFGSVCSASGLRESRVYSLAGLLPASHSKFDGECTAMLVYARRTMTHTSTCTGLHLATDSA